MSAYMVEKNHVLYLAQAASDYEAKWMPNGKDWRIMRRSAPFSEIMEVAQILWDQNLRSVNYRYNEVGGENIYTISRRDVETAFSLDPVQVIKACHCLAYQSCETPDYDETEAGKICKAIEAAAIRHLPGYRDAEWGAPKGQPLAMRLM